MSSNPRPASLYLAIDQGGHASRALVVDATGAIVARGECAVDARRVGDDLVEYDAEALVDSVRDAIAAATGALGERRRDLVAAGLATQRSGVVCWDRASGAALSPVISWQDRRDAAWLRRLDHERATVRRITGLPPSAHYGANKLRWCLAHLPAVRRALREDRLAWGPIAAFLLFRLLRGRPLLVDRVNAARMQLYDLAAADWSAELLELFGLPRAPLPETVPCSTAFGILDGDGWSIPLTVATGDQSASLYAAGPPAPDRLYCTAGTGAFVLRTASPGAAPAPEQDQLLSGLLYDDGSAPVHVREGTVNGAGSALEWLARQTGADPVPALPRWLDEVSEPPLFLNGVSGLGTPYLIADAPVAFIGDGDARARAVAVVESIVFLLQVNIERLAGAGPRPVALCVGGGLARLDGLCHRLAALSGLRVERDEEPETTALGLAWLVRKGIDAAMPEWFPAARPRTIFEPDADPDLDRRYRRWRDALASALAVAVPAQDLTAAAPAVVAHRGDAGRFPENTWPAIESALRAGLRDIEIDVQLSADRVPVLCHDVALERTTGAAGHVTQTPLATLRTLAAGEPSRFGARFREVPLPTLADVITRLAAWPDARLFVEIKQESIDAFGIDTVVAQVLAVLAPRREHCIVISYNADVLQAASRSGAQSIGWVLTRYDDASRALARRLAPEYLFCNQRKLPRARPLWNGPWRWVIYEIGTPALAASLAARGVDMIETMQVGRFTDER